MAVQVAHPQLCHSNLSKGAIEKKSNVCKQISEVVQKILVVDIAGEKVFEAIPSVETAPAPTPFSFETCAKSKTSAPKASTVAVQVAHPQLCHSNLGKGAIEKKSNVCKQISEVVQKILVVDIAGEKVFEAIPSVETAPAPTPFSFETCAKSKISAPKVSTVAVQVAHPQLCHSNLGKGAIEKKSNVCKQISEVVQKILVVDIAGGKVFEAIPSVDTAPAPTPFSFETCAKSKTSAPKASTVLENFKPSSTKQLTNKAGTKT